MPPADPSLRRHDWVWPTPDWADRLLAPVAPPARLALTAWIAAGRPLVVGRRQAEDDPASVRLGFAMPDKTRWGVHLGSAAILRPGAPPSLDEIRASVPETWSPALGHLAESLAEAGIVAGVFGSFAWQYRAQGTRAYVTAASDIDLLFTVPDGAGLDRLFRILERHHAHFPVLRIDGEIWLPDGGAVAWRELAAHSDEGRPQVRKDKILVKSLDRLDLRCRDAVLSQFRRSAA